MRTCLQKRALSTCFILFVALSIASCKKDNNPTPGVDTPLNLPAGSSTVTTAANQFAFNLFQNVLQTEPPGTNNLISPLSIYMALCMTYNGAGSTTADSMAAAMDITGLPVGQLNAVCKAILQQMPKEDNKVQFLPANSIWYTQTGPQPGPAFVDTVTNEYLGTAQALDFTSPAAVNTINSWVAKNTDNKIPTILQSLDPSAEMLLVNAIFFNGSWLNAFKTGNTQDAPFYFSNGSSVSVPFMNQQVTLRAYVGPTFTLAELPYGTGKAFDMYLVIPNSETQPINNFAASLTADSLVNASTHLDSMTVRLTIPKWEYACSIDNLQPELTQMGMGIAFSNAANFAAMYPTSPNDAISRVIHKTWIQVSETGTQAAAVTAVEMVLTSVAAPPTIRADHPFVYVITEKQTGMILFMGILNDPSQH
jgi:serine protease inhibitor